MNVSTATTAELLAFFNANTGGSQVKKFADRKTSERRVSLLIAEMIEDGDSEDMSTATVDPVTSAIVKGSNGTCADDFDNTCPACGGREDITTGRIVIRVGHQVLIDEGVFTHHGCGHEWGVPDAPAKTAKAPEVFRFAMSESLKLDRQIREVTTNLVYENACQVWKAGLVSSSQGDRLSAVLYGAAKNGDRNLVVTVNGHVFALANK